MVNVPEGNGLGDALVILGPCAKRLATGNNARQANSEERRRRGILVDQFYVSAVQPYCGGNTLFAD